MRSIKSGVVNSDLVFPNTQAISSYNHLYWKCLSLTSDKHIYIFHACPSGQGGREKTLKFEDLCSLIFKELF